MFICCEEMATMRNCSRGDKHINCASLFPFSDKMVLQFRSPCIVFPRKVDQRKSSKIFFQCKKIVRVPYPLKDLLKDDAKEINILPLLNDCFEQRGLPIQ